jgi:hypothetical protein
MKMEDCEIKLSVWRTSEAQDVEIVLWPRETLDELQRARPDRLLLHIANVANHGGLCGRFPPRTSLIVIDESAPASSRLRRRLRIRGIDPGAWRVLLGVYLAASVRGFPLQRLELTSLNRLSAVELNAEDAFAIPYPEEPEELPFPVERSIFGSSHKNRLIRICFVEPPDEEAVRELISALLSWDQLLWGGYPLEGQSPMQNATDAAEAYLVDPLTVEHPLPAFLGSDYAFDAVVCMAWWFHERGLRVARVQLW